MLELNSRLKRAIAVPPVSAIDVCRNNLASGTMATGAHSQNELRMRVFCRRGGRKRRR
jgi:hypothetical protein